MFVKANSLSEMMAPYFPRTIGLRLQILQKISFGRVVAVETGRDKKSLNKCSLKDLMKHTFLCTLLSHTEEG
jgi:DNA helicase TIP49 (TBP-interacting protein)